MPPVRKTIRVQPDSCYDGSTDQDFRDRGVNLIYIRDFISNDEADTIFRALSENGPLAQHSYLNRFKVQITPHRLTHAHVPAGRRYRFMGKDLNRAVDQKFSELFDSLVTRLQDRLGQDLLEPPNATVSNGYRYNGDDYIAPHTDDEKFLDKANTEYWEDSTVFTLTLLADQKRPMKYQFADPTIEGSCVSGYQLTPLHGSLIMQGSVLHTVIPARGPPSGIGRISVTLRSLQDCSHPKPCTKITCPRNAGPSNYLYYSNSSALKAAETEAVAAERVRIKPKLKTRSK